VEVYGSLKAMLAGALLLRRDAMAPIGAAAMAIVAPSQNPLQRDRIRLLVPETASEEEETQAGGLKVVLKAKVIAVSALHAEYTLLVPHLVMPFLSNMSEGMARVAVRSASGFAVASCTEYLESRPQAIRIAITSKDTTAASGVHTAIIETNAVAFLQSIDVAATGARSFDDTTFRTITGGPTVQNACRPGDEPGRVEPVGINMLRPFGVAHMPAMPHPPVGMPPMMQPPMMQPPTGIFGAGIPIPPPPPSGVRLNLTGGATDAVPAHFVRKILENLSDFAALTNTGWAAMPQAPVVQALGRIVKRLDAVRPFATQEEADRYVIKANSIISLMFTDAVVSAVRHATSEPAERAEMLRPHSLIERTPPAAQTVPPPDQHSNRRKRQAASSAGSGGGNASRSLGGAMGTVNIDNIEELSGSGDSSDSSGDDDKRPGRRPGKRNKQKHDGAENFPTLSSLCPDDSNISEFAEALQEVAAGRGSATRAIVEALKLSEAGRDLARAMGVEFVEHHIEPDDPLWHLIRPILESPPSPSHA